jgi:hypothetical protein
MVAVNASPPIRSMRELVEGLRRACQEREISYTTLESIAGVTDGYVGKLMAHQPMKNLGYQSTGDLLGALGKMLVMIDDPEQIARVKARWKKRKMLGGAVRPKNEGASILMKWQKIKKWREELPSAQRIKIGASTGGKRRAQVLGKRERKRIATQAAEMRWSKVRASKEAMSEVQQ